MPARLQTYYIAKTTNNKYVYAKNQPTKSPKSTYNGDR